MCNALRLYFRRENTVRRYICCTNGCNTTLGHNMLLILQTTYTNGVRRLAVRASNERPYKLTTTFIYKLKSHQSFFRASDAISILYYLLKLGTAARRNFQFLITCPSPYHHICPETKLCYRPVYMK